MLGAANLLAEFERNLKDKTELSQSLKGEIDGIEEKIERLKARAEEKKRKYTTIMSSVDAIQKMKAICTGTPDLDFSFAACRDPSPQPPADTYGVLPMSPGPFVNFDEISIMDDSSTAEDKFRSWTCPYCLKMQSEESASMADLCKRCKGNKHLSCAPCLKILLDAADRGVILMRDPKNHAGRFCKKYPVPWLLQALVKHPGFAEELERRSLTFDPDTPEKELTLQNALADFIIRK